MIPSLAADGIEALPTTWHVPHELLRLRGIRRDPLLCYLVLWQCVGCRPGRLTVDYLRLRATLSASEHGVRRWLATLERVGLIDILHRGPRQALLRIRDWQSPREGDPKPVTDVQQLDLPFAEPAPARSGPTTIPIWSGRNRTERKPHGGPTAG